LLQVKGKANKVRFWEVPLQRDSLNSGDVFILGKNFLKDKYAGA